MVFKETNCKHKLCLTPPIQFFQTINIFNRYYIFILGVFVAMCLRDVLSQMKANFFAALTLGSKMSEKIEVWSGLNLHFKV